MRNKSRKRILHEQRVEIARLNREIESWRCALERAHWFPDPTKTIQYSHIIYNDDIKDKREELFAYVGERFIRDLVRIVVASNVMQITTDPMEGIGATRVTLKLKLLVPEHTDIEPAEAFKNVKCVDFREPEIMFGGYQRSREDFIRQRYEEVTDPVSRIVIKDGYQIKNNVWKGNTKNEKR